MITTGDCLDVMAAMEPASVDAIVTDPPYGLEFMGKEWDRLGDIGKTSHSGPAERDASTVYGRTRVGFFGSSNLKCRKCGKWQWDHEGRKCECVEPDFPNRNRHQGLLMQEWHQRWATEALRVAKPGAYLLAFGGTRTYHRLACAIEDAGWIIRDCLVWAYASGFPKSKASLKPAWEPIVMARKPGPLRELAIDACRIGVGGDKGEWPATDRPPSIFADGAKAQTDQTLGRWPANVVLTDPIFDGDVDGVVGGGADHSQTATYRNDSVPSMFSNGRKADTTVGYGDTGTYSRFFLIPKADRAEREPVFGGLAERPSGTMQDDAYTWEREIERGRQPRNTQRKNHHPTVKPLDLMRHLVRLVTPIGGVVLDPFAGSGTTLIAAEMEGFAWLGIEREPSYVEIAQARLMGVQKGLGLDVPAPLPKMTWKPGQNQDRHPRNEYQRNDDQWHQWANELGGASVEQRGPVDGVDLQLFSGMTRPAESDEVG